MIDGLKNNIKQAEGFRSAAYVDPLGYWTIGYGRMIDKRLNGGITEQEADLLLENDINRVLRECRDHFSWFKNMSENRKAAIAEMCFQLGLSRLLGFTNMLKCMGNGDYKQAAQEALASKWAGQVPLRAHRIAAMIVNG